jgi:histidine triad (HIT) family protein
MYNHEPPGYICPFCEIITRAKVGQPLTQLSEVVYYSEMATAFLAIHRRPKNPVNVLVVPNAHIENIYDLPLEYASPIHQLTRAIAISLKVVYGCDGVSTRQHNEPAGSQDVWHYHVHVTPRFPGDNFYKSHWMEFPIIERLEYAFQLRKYVYAHQEDLFIA